jgi:hypothetical protein
MKLLYETMDMLAANPNANKPPAPKCWGLNVYRFYWFLVFMGFIGFGPVGSPEREWEVVLGLGSRGGRGRG